MNKKHKRLSLKARGLLLILLSIFAFSLVPIKAHAEPLEFPWDKYAKEYKAYVATRVVLKCVDEEWDQGKPKNDDYAYWGISDNTDVVSGSVAGLGRGANGTVECATPEDLNSAAVAMGYTDAKDMLTTTIFPTAPDKIKSCGDKKERICPLGESSKVPDKFDLEDALVKHIISKGLDNDEELSEAAQVWFWDSVFRKKDQENGGGCGGRFSNTDTSTINGPGYFRDSGSDNYYKYTNPRSGKYDYAEFRYADWDVSAGDTGGQGDGNSIEDVANDLLSYFAPTSLLNPNIYGTGKDKNCQQIAELAGHIFTNGIIQIRKDAEAYYANCGTDVGCAPATTPTPGETPGDDGNGSGPTCESVGWENGWIVCPFYNMFSTATEFFYGAILQPFLTAPPVDVTPGAENRTFQAWSNFRFYGNIFLVLAMLAIVFGQSIGGGLIDAYTAKKVMPRILGAAIMINISIYLVAILVDVTNAAGNGIFSLIMAPFGDATISGGTSTAIAGIIGLVIGTVGGAGAIVGFAGAATSGTLGPVVIMLIFTVVIPLLLALLGIFVTLVIRRGLILALVLISPVAFALYCLPNTEKYFKKWWETLLKALLVYPIIMAIFAVSNVLSITIFESSGTTISTGSQGLQTLSVPQGIAGLVAIFVQLVPLFMIPFAFKFAGGAMASLYAAIESGGKRAGGALKSRQDQAKKDYKGASLQARQRAYDTLGARGDRRGRFGRGAYRFAQNRVGGRNMHLALSEYAAEQFKEAEAQKATGIDDEQRALTVNKAWALRQDAAAIAAGVDGNHVRTRDGRRQFRTLGGRWVTEANVDNAHQRWGGNMAQMQWSLGYEMSKAATQEEMDYLYGNYGRLNEAGSGLSLSSGQMGGMWQGAAFAQQNQDRQYKHYAWGGIPGSDDEGLRMSGVNMMREIDERQGNWAMMSQSADTWTTMSEEVNRARRIVGGTATAQEQGTMTEQDAREVLQRGARVAKSLGGGYRGQDGQWIDTGVGQGASGRTKEEIENYAALFDPKKIGRDDYVREVGTERRGTAARSGADAATGAGYGAPPVDAATGLPMSRPSSQTDITGVRVDRPNPSRNPPRTP